MTVLDLPPEQRAREAAARLWGCPRPDKHHYMTARDAQEALDWHVGRPEHDPSANVYRCGCGGFVWGRRKSRPAHQ
jgi:hypothetical protein